MVHLQVKNTLGSNFLSLALWGWVAHLSLGAIVLKMHALKVVWCHIMIKLKFSSLGKQKLERNCKKMEVAHVAFALMCRHRHPNAAAFE